MGEHGSGKLLILGFDGASPDLFSKWLSQGELPNLEAIIKDGVYGPLRSVPNMSSPPAWTSFATGKNPGKHGVFCFTARDFKSYKYTFVNGRFRRAETFWSMLCGERTGCIVNVPMTYPAEPINGCLIAGLDAPGIDSPGVCYPENLLAEMTEKNGPYKITPDFASYLRKGAHWGEAADRLLENMDRRFRHTRFLMKKYDWDLFSVVFGETDLAHHFFWKFLDRSHPDCTEEDFKLYGDSILKIYKKMDEITGRLMEINPDATVLIVSDHGGGLNSRAVELVADWLENMDLLTRESTSWRNPARLAGGGLSSLAGKGFRLANQKLSKKTKLKLARFLPGLRATAESASRLGGIDWSKTKAFCDGAQDDIWINLAGRDPIGVVHQTEYDATCEFICSELRDAVDSVTGQPIVDDVFRRGDKYSGEHLEIAPDISVRWKTDAVVNGIKTKNTPKAVVSKKWTWPADIPTGGHSLDGILIAHGPGIRKNFKIEGAQIMDIAPTVLYIFGESIPDDFDGKLLDKLFEESYISSHQPKYGSKTGAEQDKSSDVYSDEDSSIIEQRLKDLGYI